MTFKFGSPFTEYAFAEALSYEGMKFRTDQSPKSNSDEKQYRAFMKIDRIFGSQENLIGRVILKPSSLGCEGKFLATEGDSAGSAPQEPILSQVELVGSACKNSQHPNVKVAACTYYIQHAGPSELTGRNTKLCLSAAYDNRAKALSFLGTMDLASADQEIATQLRQYAGEC